MTSPAINFTPQTSRLGDEVECPPQSRQVTLRALHNFIFYESDGRWAEPIPDRLNKAFWESCRVEGHVAPLCGRTRFLVQSGYWEVPFGDLEYAVMRIDDITGMHLEQDSQFRGGAPSLYIYTPKFAYALMAPSPPYLLAWRRVVRDWMLTRGKNLEFTWVNPTLPCPRWWTTKGDWLALQSWYAEMVAQQDKGKTKEIGKGKGQGKGKGKGKGKATTKAPQATSGLAGSKHKSTGGVSAPMITRTPKGKDTKGKGKGKDELEGDNELEQDELEQDEPEAESDGKEQDKGEDEEGARAGGDDSERAAEGAVPQRIPRRSTRVTQMKRTLPFEDRKEGTTAAPPMTRGRSKGAPKTGKGDEGQGRAAAGRSKGGEAAAAGPSRLAKGGKRTRQAAQGSGNTSDASIRSSKPEAKRLRPSSASAGAKEGLSSKSGGEGPYVGMGDTTPNAPSPTEAPEAPRSPSSSAAGLFPSSPKNLKVSDSGSTPRSSTAENVDKDMEISDAEDNTRTPIQALALGTLPSTLHFQPPVETAVVQKSLASSASSPRSPPLSLDLAGTCASVAPPTLRLSAPPAAPPLPDSGLTETLEKSARVRATNIASLCNPAPESSLEPPAHAAVEPCLTHSTSASHCAAVTLPLPPAPITPPQCLVEHAGGTENPGVEKRKTDLDRTPDDLEHGPTRLRLPGPALSQ